MRSSEAGFGVLEVLVAGAIFVLVAFAGLSACTALAQALRSATSAASSQSGLDAEVGQLRDDAASAFAIWLPEAGAASAGGVPEIDFYARTGDGGDRFWRYLYDPAAHTVQRWDFDPTGAAGVRDSVTGQIDTAAAYPPLRDVTSWNAVALPADALADSARNPYAGLGGLFAHAPAAHAVPYSVHAAGIAPVGGNGVVTVSFSSAAGGRSVHLVAGVLPAGFTVTGALDWHAIVYRVDQTHRFAGGLAGKSHVFINARVDVSYDGWITRQTWCDFNLLGKPDGLDPHDPHADYKPAEAVEQAPSILAACRARWPVPPPRGAGSYAPDADTPRAGGR